MVHGCCRTAAAGTSQSSSVHLFGIPSQRFSGIEAIWTQDNDARPCSGSPRARLEDVAAEDALAEYRYDLALENGKDPHRV